MALHPLAANFAAVADSYDRGRPDYARAVVGALAAELKLAPGARVLDLAAGTGKLTRALVRGGLDVVAIEPQSALRALLAAAVGPERVRDGLAEAIPLAEDSVEAVTVADAFHWFEARSALAEIARVLRPGGGLVVLASAPDWSGASWAQEIGSLLTERRPQHPHFDGPPWQGAVAAAGNWTELRELRVTSPQPIDPLRTLDYLASISWVAAMEDARRRALLDRAAEIIAAGETPATMMVDVVLNITTLR